LAWIWQFNRKPRFNLLQLVFYWRLSQLSPQFFANGACRDPRNIRKDALIWRLRPLISIIFLTNSQQIAYFITAGAHARKVLRRD